MSFDPNNPIQDDEYLFRSFQPLEWNFPEDRPNSSIFQSSSPISVDRDGKRADEDVIKNFRSRIDNEKCGLVKHTAKTYREFDTEPIPDPIDNNEFHALVNGKGIIGTKRKHASKLCRNSFLVTMAEYS